MAVEVGFEPTEVLPPHTLSRRARSATTRLHRDGAYRAGSLTPQALRRRAAGPLSGEEISKQRSAFGLAHPGYDLGSPIESAVADHVP
jgi:hypothetical protein